MMLYDSDQPSAIPTDAVAVAGYGDGYAEPAWTNGGWARFPNAHKLVIVVHAGDQGDVLDVERGDASPADCPGWCDRFSRPGRRAPTLYCNRSSWPAVRAAVAGRRVDYWISTLDGTTDVPGAVAVQYAGSATSGGHFDRSLILDPGWLGTAPPQAPLEEPMLLFLAPSGVGYLLSGGLLIGIPDQQDFQALKAAGIPSPPQALTQPFMDDLAAAMAAQKSPVSGSVSVSGTLNVG
jgi:hypothetical protein